MKKTMNVSGENNKVQQNLYGGIQGSEWNEMGRKNRPPQKNLFFPIATLS